MRIKQKIINFIQGLSETVRLYPMEIGMAAIYCVLACLNYRLDFSNPSVKTLLIYFPIAFLFTFLLNDMSRGSKWRLGYYLSAFAGLGLLGVSFETDVYFISLIVIQLLLLIRNGSIDNKAFVEYTLRYINALFSAALISCIAWLLVLSVYFSIRYIFDIWSENTIEKFIVYSSFVIFMILAPVLFLTFRPKKEGEIQEANRSFDVLLNYILSPILLVYAVILYMYLGKIVFSCSLPKGGVAYIVAGFVTYAYILKGLQFFLVRRFYDWFFNHISLIVLPTLGLYWVGACYRIHQYGFTEPRVYLVLIGWILTIMALLFLFRRTGRYWYVAVIAVFSVSLITYVPGWTAHDIEEWSQKGREQVENADILPEEDENKNIYLEIKNDTVIDVSGFDRLEEIWGYANEGLWLELEDDCLSLYRGEQVVSKVDTRQFLKEQLQKAGIGLNDTIPHAIYSDLLRVKVDSGIIQLRLMMLERIDSVYVVSQVGNGYLLSADHE